MTDIKIQAKEELKPYKGLGFLRKVFLGISALIIFVCLIMLAEVSQMPTLNHDHKAKEIRIDPEIRIISEYQQARNSKIPVELAEIQAEILVSVAAAEKLPVSLLVGITETESLFNPMVVSSAGAAGLMQVLIEDGVEIDLEQVHDCRYNVEKGAEILHSKLKKSEGSLTKALRAYSGHATDYDSRVLENVGRYVMFKATNSEIKVVER